MVERSRELHVRITAAIDPSFKKAAAEVSQIISSLGVINDVANRATGPMRQVGAAMEGATRGAAKSAQSLSQQLDAVINGYLRIRALQGGVTTPQNISRMLGGFEGLVRRQGAIPNESQLQIYKDVLELQRQIASAPVEKRLVTGLSRSETLAALRNQRELLRVRQQEMAQIQSQAVFENQTRRLQFSDVQTQAVFENRARDILSRRTEREARLRAAGVQTGAIFENRARDLQEQARLAAARRGMIATESEAIFENRALDRFRAGARAVTRGGEPVRETARNVRSLMDEIRPGHIAAWALQWNLVYAAINKVQQGIAAVTIGAVDLARQFQTRVLVLTATIQNTRIGTTFQQAHNAATRLVRTIDELSLSYSGSRDRLEQILQSMLQWGILTDLTTEKQKRDFVVVAEAIDQATMGMAKQGSIYDEIRSLLTGNVTRNTQLLQLLKAQDPELQKNLAYYRAQGKALEYIASLLPGTQEKLLVINQTLDKQMKDFQINMELIFRDVGKPIVDTLIPAMQQLNSLLRNNREELVVAARIASSLLGIGIAGAIGGVGATLARKSILGVGAQQVSRITGLPFALESATPGALAGVAALGRSAIAKMVVSALARVFLGPLALPFTIHTIGSVLGGYIGQKLGLRSTGLGGYGLESLPLTPPRDRIADEEAQARLRMLGLRQLEIQTIGRTPGLPAAQVSYRAGLVANQRVEVERLKATETDRDAIRNAKDQLEVNQLLEATAKRREEIIGNILNLEQQILSVDKKLEQEFKDRIGVEHRVEQQRASLVEQRLRNELAYDIALQRIGIPQEKERLEAILKQVDAQIEIYRMEVKRADTAEKHEAAEARLEQEIDKGRKVRIEIDQHAIRSINQVFGLMSKSATAGGNTLFANILQSFLGTLELRRQFPQNPAARSIIEEIERNERRRIHQEFRFGQEDVIARGRRGLFGVRAEGAGALAGIARNRPGIFGEQISAFTQFRDMLARDLPQQLESVKTRIEALLKGIFDPKILKMFEQEQSVVIANMKAFEEITKRIAVLRQEQDKAGIEALRTQKEANKGRLFIVDQEITRLERRKQVEGLPAEEKIRLNEELRRLHSERARLRAQGATDESDLQRTTKITQAREKLAAVDEEIAEERRKLEAEHLRISREIGLEGTTPERIERLEQIRQGLSYFAQGLLPPDLLKKRINAQQALADAMRAPEGVAQATKRAYDNAAQAISRLNKEDEQLNKDIRERGEETAKKLIEAFKGVIDVINGMTSAMNAFRAALGLPPIPIPGQEAKNPASGTPGAIFGRGGPFKIDPNRPEFGTSRTIFSKPVTFLKPSEVSPPEAGDLGTIARESPRLWQDIINNPQNPEYWTIGPGRNSTKPTSSIIGGGSIVVINGMQIEGASASKITAIIQSEVFGSRGADEASFQASRLGPRQAVG